MDSLKIRRIEHDLEIILHKLAQLLPKQYQQLFKESAFIAGGSIYNLYHNETPKDYDFFLTDVFLGMELREYFENIPNLQQKKYVKLGFYKGLKLIISDNAISIGDYQIITKWSGVPEIVLSDFDFKHNQFYYHKGVLHNYVDWDYLETDKLYFNDDRPRDICGCIVRVHKFLERGFKISNRKMSKMLLKLKEVGFNDREVEILDGYDRDFES